MPNLTRALRQAEKRIQPLRGLTIETINFFNIFEYEEERIDLMSSIENLFDGISTIKWDSVRSVGSTATSKILHMTVPELFVMNDKDIRFMYGCERNGAGYVNFMIRMSHLSREIISQKGEFKKQLHTLTHIEARTLARLLDIYNYMKRPARAILYPIKVQGID